MCHRRFLVSPRSPMLFSLYHCNVPQAFPVSPRCPTTFSFYHHHVQRSFYCITTMSHYLFIVSPLCPTIFSLYHHLCSFRYHHRFRCSFRCITRWSQTHFPWYHRGFFMSHALFLVSLGDPRPILHGITGIFHVPCSFPCITRWSQTHFAWYHRYFSCPMLFSLYH